MIWHCLSSASRDKYCVEVILGAKRRFRPRNIPRLKINPGIPYWDNFIYYMSEWKYDPAMLFWRTLIIELSHNIKEPRTYQWTISWNLGGNLSRFKI